MGNYRLLDIFQLRVLQLVHGSFLPLLSGLLNFLLKPFKPFPLPRLKRIFEAGDDCAESDDLVIRPLQISEGLDVGVFVWVVLVVHGCASFLGWFSWRGRFRCWGCKPKKPCFGTESCEPPQQSLCHTLFLAWLLREPFEACGGLRFLPQSHF